MHHELNFILTPHPHPRCRADPNPGLPVSLPGFEAALLAAHRLGPLSDGHLQALPTCGLQPFCLGLPQGQTRPGACLSVQTCGESESWGDPTGRGRGMSASPESLQGQSTLSSERSKRDQGAGFLPEWTAGPHSLLWTLLPFPTLSLLLHPAPRDHLQEQPDDHQDFSRLCWSQVSPRA